MLLHFGSLKHLGMCSALYQSHCVRPANTCPAGLMHQALHAQRLSIVLLGSCGQACVCSVELGRTMKSCYALATLLRVLGRRSAFAEQSSAVWDRCPSRLLTSRRARWPRSLTMWCTAVTPSCTSTTNLPCSRGVFLACPMHARRKRCLSATLSPNGTVSRTSGQNPRCCLSSGKVHPPRCCIFFCNTFAAMAVSQIRNHCTLSLLLLAKPASCWFQYLAA